MRTPIPIALLGLALTGCGLESFFGNVGHSQNERPASKISGHLTFPSGTIAVTDADGKPYEPFLNVVDVDAGTYEVRLPSSTYNNLVVVETVGNTELRSLVPSVGQESAVVADLDARNTTEAMITEARLAANGASWKQVNPATYLPTRARIQADLAVAGSVSGRLLKYVENFLTGATDIYGGGDPGFFLPPVLAPNPDGGTFLVTTSPVNRDWLNRTPFDYVGDGRARRTTDEFDTALASAAALYAPSGCPDPQNIRVIFTVNFNAGILNGNCQVGDRFKWANDKPGKSMFFVGWIHKDSPFQDPLVNARLGAGVPNQMPMHDDGQAGDEVASDNIWTIVLDVPRGTYIGYKYTWGFRASLWTGTEEWPGNSRIIEATDVDGDQLVYRRDVFGDEATNKDRQNLNLNGNGSLQFGQVLRPGWGVETREQQLDTNQDCKPDRWAKPTSVGALTVPLQQGQLVCP